MCLNKYKICHSSLNWFLLCLFLGVCVCVHMYMCMLYSGVQNYNHVTEFSMIAIAVFDFLRCSMDMFAPMQIDMFKYSNKHQSNFSNKCLFFESQV